MAVLSKDVSFSAFNEKHINVHKYEVLSGLHSFQAKDELMKEYPENPFFNEALAEVYIDLSDEQALRLACKLSLYTQNHSQGFGTYICLCSYGSLGRVHVGMHVYTYVILTFESSG